ARPAQAPVVAVPVRLPERWTIDPPARPTKSLWSLVPWLLLVVAGLLALAVSSSPRPMTTDSPEFRNALERWSTVIQLRQTTPRAQNPSLTGCPFGAWRRRAEPPRGAPVPPGNPLSPRRAEVREAPASMSEAALVALASLHEIRPELVLTKDALEKGM